MKKRVIEELPKRNLLTLENYMFDNRPAVAIVYQWATASDGGIKEACLNDAFLLDIRSKARLIASDTRKGILLIIINLPDEKIAKMVGTLLVELACVIMAEFSEVHVRYEHGYEPAWLRSGKIEDTKYILSERARLIL